MLKPVGGRWPARAAALVALLVLASLMLAAACQTTSPPQGPPAGAQLATGSPPLQVVATVYPLEEFARFIGGQRVEVSSLLPPGTDAHDYEPGPRDLRKVMGSHLFIYNGAQFEPWTKTVLPVLDAEAPDLLTVEATAGIALGPPGRPDPHVWLDPPRAAQQAATIAAAFQKADPAGAAFYAERNSELQRRLGRLAADYAAGLAQCRQTKLLVQHGAFYYWERFGLEQEPLTEGDQETEPSPRRLVQLAGWLRHEGGRAIFIDPWGSNAGAETLALETGAEMLPLHPLENLTAAEAARGEGYFTLMEKNLANLRRGLQCGD